MIALAANSAATEWARAAVWITIMVAIVVWHWINRRYR